MKLRIDLRPVVADPLHGARIGLYILLLAAGILQLQRFLLQGAGWGRSIDGASPWIALAQPPLLAGGIEVQEGIQHFNGKSGRGVWTGQTTSVLVSVVATYVLGPALFVWGLRARARRRQNPLREAGATTIAAALTLGGLSLVSIIPAPMYAVMSSRAHSTMVHDCQVSAMQDEMSEDLFQMARRAQVIYFLPGGMGGGNQSWLAHDRSGKPVIDISRILLAAPSADVDAVLSCSRNCSKYSLRVERADSLTIKGVTEGSDVQGTDGDAESVHAAKVQMCIGVTPDRVNVVFLN